MEIRELKKTYKRGELVRTDIEVDGRPVILRKKSSSYLMRFLGVILCRFTPEYMRYFWTTIRNTIYFPTYVVDPLEAEHLIVLEHELLHVKQFRQYGLILMGLFYTLLPLPIFFSGRWFIERSAYLHDIQRSGRKVEEAINLLWKNYGFPWPRFLMRRWFKKHL